MYWNLLSHTVIHSDWREAIKVLILIVLEFALARLGVGLVSPVRTCLNPYCTGICSRTTIFLSLGICYIRLNPYCTGICSRTALLVSGLKKMGVLILIVLEFALAPKSHFRNLLLSLCLNPYCTGICSRTDQSWLFRQLWFCLNPYCTGICSRTKTQKTIEKKPAVLILIVLEFALAPRQFGCFQDVPSVVLILIVLEFALAL